MNQVNGFTLVSTVYCFCERYAYQIFVYNLRFTAKFITQRSDTDSFFFSCMKMTYFNKNYHQWLMASGWLTLVHWQMFNFSNEQNSWRINPTQKKTRKIFIYYVLICNIHAMSNWSSKTQHEINKKQIQLKYDSNLCFSRKLFFFIKRPFLSFNLLQLAMCIVIGRKIVH